MVEEALPNHADLDDSGPTLSRTPAGGIPVAGFIRSVAATSAAAGFAPSRPRGLFGGPGMVVRNVPFDPDWFLRAADAALEAAAARLAEAADAYRRAGRADLAGQLTSAMEVFREVELARLTGVGAPPARTPTDWFQD
jgi:hypothetical protein